MKRKEREADLASPKTSTNSSAVPPASKRPKLRENDDLDLDCIAPDVLERFAAESRRQMQKLRDQDGLALDIALDQVISHLRGPPNSSRAPSFTRADLKLVRKLTGFDYINAERVLLLRDELIAASRARCVEPADAVDALTERLTQEFNINAKKRSLQLEEYEKFSAERPQKRHHEDGFPKKRSFSEQDDRYFSFGSTSTPSGIRNGQTPENDESDGSKRRKLGSERDSSSFFSQLTSFFESAPIPAFSTPERSESSGPASQAAPPPRPSFLSRITSAFLGNQPSQALSHSLDRHVASDSPAASPSIIQSPNQPSLPAGLIFTPSPSQPETVGTTFGIPFGGSVFGGPAPFGGTFGAAPPPAPVFGFGFGSPASTASSEAPREPENPYD